MPKTATPANTEAPKAVSTTLKTFTPVGDLLRQSWELLKISWKNLLLLSIALWVIVGVLMLIAGGSIAGSFALAMGGGSFLSGASGVAFFVGIAVVIFLAVVVSVFGTAMMLAVAEADKRPELGSLVTRGFKLFWPVLLTSLIMMFLINGGFFFFIIPGIVIAILTGFSIYEVVFTEHKYLAAVKNSIRIVGQNFGELFIRVLVVFGLSFALFVVQSILQGIMGDNSGAQGLVALVMMVVQTMFGWYIMGYYYLVYKEARALTDFNKNASMAWIWIVSVLGWVIGIFFAAAASAFITNMMKSSMRDGDTNLDAPYGTNNQMMPMDGSSDVNTEEFLNEYGQDMTEEEKAMFRQIIESTESTMEEDQNATMEEQSL